MHRGPQKEFFSQSCAIATVIAYEQTTPAHLTLDDMVDRMARHRGKSSRYLSDRFVRESVLLILFSYICASSLERPSYAFNSTIPGSTALLIYCVPAEKPR